MSNPDRAHEAFFDIDPVTGAAIEVFFADRSLETFGWRGAGWFWWLRQRGFAPTGPAIGPFPTSYSAYRDALNSVENRPAHFRQQVEKNTQVAKRLQCRL
jgi:hypothetical protein